ncbi:MAG: hypothetical protein NC910_04460 [Candidatus Omnitrophica bacterium]|nr:hypothetical protein [Candidatus Omnitrophota bacterium]
MTNRKSFVWLAGFLAVFLWASDGWSAKKPAPTTAKPQKTPEELALEAEKKAREALNGTQWEIQLAPMSDKKEKAVADILRFEKGKISSEWFGKKGYEPTNFSISIKGGVPVWETMQSASEGGDVVFWQGQLFGETMSGILSQHDASGTVTDWSFSGRLKPAAPPEPPPATETPAQPPAEETSVSQQAQPTSPPAAQPEKPAATTKKTKKK